MTISLAGYGPLRRPGTPQHLIFSICMRCLGASISSVFLAPTLSMASPPEDQSLLSTAESCLFRQGESSSSCTSSTSLSTIESCLLTTGVSSSSSTSSTFISTTENHLSTAGKSSSSSTLDSSNAPNTQSSSGSLTSWVHASGSLPVALD
jgi:hypothetical protein